MRPTTLASQHFPSGPFRAPSGTKLTLHACWSVRTGTKLARHTRRHAQTGTKLARHTRRPPQPVQNSPGTHAGSPQPVQNSPYTAKIAHFAPFSACRAKNVTLSAQALAAGRLFSRCGFEQSKLGDLCRATSGGFAHGALHLHRNHLLGPRKARAGTHTAFMSTMSHGDWDALKEISPLLGIAPAGMKYKSPLLA